MTENERVKQLRKARGLTLEKFGERLGVGKSAISDIERGRNSVTDQMRRSICREFGVREEWLRDGTGEMEDSTDTFDLDELADRNHATPLERELIKAYFELDVQMRRIVVEKFSNVFGKFDVAEFTSVPDEELELAHQILQDKRAEDASPVSSGADGRKKEA